MQVEIRVLHTRLQVNCQIHGVACLVDKWKTKLANFVRRSMIFVYVYKERREEPSEHFEYLPFESHHMTQSLSQGLGKSGFSTN